MPDVSSLEEILALANASQTPLATPTPMPTFTPTPVATPAPMMTPAQEPGFLDVTSRAISSGISDIPQNYASLLSALSSAPSALASLTEPGALTRVGEAIISDPLATLRTGGRLAFGVGGGIAGALRGAGAGALTSPVTGPVGPFVGGLIGASAGASAGDIAYNKFENIVSDVATGVSKMFGGEGFAAPNAPTTPMQDYEKLLRGTVSGIGSEVIERPTLGLLEFAGKGGLAKVLSMKEARKEGLMPQPGKVVGEFTPEQKGVVGDLLQQTGVTEEQLMTAIARKNDPNATFEKTMSTAELLGNRKLIAAQAAVESSPAGQLPFLDLKEGKVKEIDNQITKLMQSADPNLREEGLALKEEFNILRKSSEDYYNSLYDKLYEVSSKEKFGTTQLSELLKDNADKYLPPGYAPDKTVMDKIIANLSPKEEVVEQAGKQKVVVQKENEYDIRNLVAASGRLKTEARKLQADPKTRGTKEAEVLEKSSEIIDSFIDNHTPFKKEFREANEARAEHAKKFQRGQLQNIKEDFVISPENIAGTLAGTTDEWVQGIKVFGDQPESVKRLLTQRLDEFAKINSVEGKIAWLDKNADLFTSTDSIPQIKEARDALIRVRDFMKQEKKFQETTKSLNFEGIGIGEVQKAALIGKTSGLGEGDKALLQAARQTARDKQRQAAGAFSRIFNKISGPLYNIPASIISGEAFKGKAEKYQRAVAEVNTLMSQALSDPEKALEMLSYAGTEAGKVAARKSTEAAALKNAKQSLVNAISGGTNVRGEAIKSGVKRGVMSALTEPAVVATPKQKKEDPFSIIAKPTATPKPSSTREVTSLEDILALADEGTPTPTPTPTAEKKGPGMVSKILRELTPMQSALAQEVSSGAIPTKPVNVKIGKEVKEFTVPVGEKFAPPKIVAAMIAVESAGKRKAVSPKGASGYMQLMPATAKSLGVTDIFDEKQNIFAGSKYIAQQIKKFGDLKLALAAYNWGPGSLNKAINRVESKGKRVTWENIKKYASVPVETVNYVSKVTSLM